MLYSGIRNATLTGIAVGMLLCSVGYYAFKPDAGREILTTIQTREQAINDSRIQSKDTTQQTRKSNRNGGMKSGEETAAMRRFATFLLMVPYLSHVDKG